VANKLSDIFGSTAECPPVEELVKALEAPRTGETRAACEQHIASCAYCSAQLALFRNFETAQPKSEERAAISAIVSRLRKESPASVEPWWSRIWKPRILAPAAIALAAASVMIVVNVHPGGSNLDTPVASVMRSNQLVPVAPLGQITQPPSQLKWQPIAAAAQYKVRLLEVDKTELWSTTTAAANIEIPSQVQAKIVPSKKILWEVTALDSTGATLASSGIRSFVVQ